MSTKITQIHRQITQITPTAHTFSNEILIYDCVQVYAKHPSVKYEVYRIAMESYLKVHS